MGNFVRSTYRRDESDAHVFPVVERDHRFFNI